LPVLPDMSNYAAVIAAQQALPLPMPPAQPQGLFQERGFRASRALPYVLGTSAFISGATITLTFANSGTQGAVFHVYDQLHLDRIPRRYTVEAGKSLNDIWSAAADAGEYNLWVYAPNGFVRSFAGNASSWTASSFQPEILVEYSPAVNQLWVAVRNSGSLANTITITPNSQFSGVDAQTVPVAAGSTIQVALSLESSASWYDFTAASVGFGRRFAGRMETGRDGISDPAFAAAI
jgi:phospholipase C